MDSLHDCLQELAQAHTLVMEQEDADLDPPISSAALDRATTHGVKLQRELQLLWTKVKPSRV